MKFKPLHGLLDQLSELFDELSIIRVFAGKKLQTEATFKTKGASQSIDNFGEDFLGLRELKLQPSSFISLNFANMLRCRFVDTSRMMGSALVNS
ncbi:hypothetical protein EDB86DRAFT_3084509 [Lactarius hatsudake]|nr:hypothetical protein EDB86DRAFT_3084509 [Lactarius hatsudake]